MSPFHTSSSHPSVLLVLLAALVLLTGCGSDPSEPAGHSETSGTATAPRLHLDPEAPDHVLNVISLVEAILFKIAFTAGH